MDKGIKSVYTENAPAPIGPYSQGVVGQGLLFISGQIAIDPASGNLILDSIEAETQQVMENIKAILVSAGSNFDKSFKASIFLKDLNNFDAVNKIYGSYFKDGAHFPARETVQVSALPKNVNVEISLIAAL